MIVSHNALAAFPLDFSAGVKSPAMLAPEVIDEWQAKSTCAGFPTDRAYLPDAQRGPNGIWYLRPDDLLKGFRSPHRGRVRRLELDMPDRVPQDSFVRRAGPFCIVLRNGAGQWLWRAQRFEPKYDAATGRSTAVVELDVADVDTIAVLFESTTALATVRYTVEHPPAAPGSTEGRGAVANASCCTACAADGADVKSRYCCRSAASPPEPCIEAQTELHGSCRAPVEIYNEAVGVCRGRGLHLRDWLFTPTDPMCLGPDGRSSTGARQARFKCCRDPWFVPPAPGLQGGAADCQFTGYSTDCRPNQEILEGAVAGCFRAGLVHKSIVFKNDCPGGSREATSICCRPGVVGPPVEHCSR